MTTSRFSQRGQGTTTSVGIVTFFLFYFAFIMVLVWLVEGIPPMFLTRDVTWLGIGSLAVLGTAMLASGIMENIPFGGGAHVAAFHTIRFSILIVIAANVGIPLYIAVNKSAMFPLWLASIFIIIPYIIFTVATYQIVMGGGGGT